jgi:ferritin-like protein
MGIAMENRHERGMVPGSGLLSRGELLRRGVGGGAVLVASGTGLAAFAAPAAADVVPDGDLAYLRLLVAAELLKADFASDALGSGKLRGSTARLFRRTRNDDLAHYKRLAALVTDSGQTPATAADIDFSYPSGTFRSASSMRTRGFRIGTLALGAYLGALENVETASLRLPLAQIAANEAQQVSALAQSVGRPTVGAAFAPALPIETVSAALDAYES